MRLRAARFAAFLTVAGFLVSAQAASAQPQPIPGTEPAGDGRTPIVTEIPIPVQPGSNIQSIVEYATTGRVQDLAQYIGIIYNFLISIVGMVAAVAMIIGGFQYLTSAGDAGRIGAAKGKMANAFIGLVLALGAYTILNTINPRLLQLSIPNPAAVKTEILYLPWCEEIAVGDPANNVPAAAVTQVGGGRECGNIGKYKRGNSEAFCVYYGSCKLKNADVVPDRPRTHTCFQNAGNTVESVTELIKKDPNSKVAHCLACAQLSNKTMREKGYTDTNQACLNWTVQVAGWQAKADPNQRYWDFCAMTEGYPGCMQVNIDCYEADNNEDAATNSDYQCNSLNYACGCEGYDDQPSPIWPRSDFSMNASEKLYYVGDDLDSYQKHLASVCMWNPCKEYREPRRVNASEHTQPFIDGCKDEGGTIGTVWNFARHGDFRFNDCRNK